MILLEVAGGIILAGILVGYWRQLTMALLALTMLSSLVLGVLQGMGK